MLKQEFENMTLRGNESISGLLYDTIERYYMSDNEYHRYNNPNGINETKQEFCKRVFGGKVNTPNTILKKMINESIKENRYCIGKYHDKKELDNMDCLITEHYTWRSKHNYC